MTKEIRRLRELAGLNRGDKFILNELFDNPYSYTWVGQDHEEWRAEFKNVDGHAIRVIFQIYHGRLADVRFYRNDEFNITGQKDQFRIFATVLNIMKDFMEDNYNVKKLGFIATEKSRASLYRRMFRRFANENGFAFEDEYNKLDDYSRFHLSRKK